MGHLGGEFTGGSSALLSSAGDKRSAFARVGKRRHSAASFVAAAAPALLVVTNHDAAKLPVHGSSSRSRRRSATHEAEVDGRSGLGGVFDAVVVDVPCSGDGTVRKDVSRREDWRPSFGVSSFLLLLLAARLDVDVSS